MLDRNFLSTTILILFLPLILKGQISQEISVGYQLQQLIGDIGVNKLQLLDGAGNLNYRIQKHPHYAFHLGFSQGILYGDDSLSSFSEKVERNIAIQTPYQAFNARVEIDYFSQLIPSYNFQQTPYIFGGIGLISFNPMGNYQGEWLELQPLGTEGQGTILNSEPLYSKRAWTLPFGIGWRAQLNSLWVFSIEAMWTLTSTDYLDDTHNLYVDAGLLEIEKGEIASYFSNPSNTLFETGTPRANPQNNDSYFALSLKFGIHIEAFMEQCAKFLHK